MSGEGSRTFCHARGKLGIFSKFVRSARLEPETLPLPLQFLVAMIAERFVRTVRHECLDEFMIFGERHLRHLLREFVAHYHRKRYHQGLGSRIISPDVSVANDNGDTGRIHRRSRLGGQLSYYHRKAA